MEKPRIVIADMNLDYIIPLQAKFVSEYFDKIELELITDNRYFETLFSVPQKAEILVISSELYDSVSLRRHNIGNIFVLTEQNEDGQTAELNVNRLFKYTSIKEIFNEVIGKSSAILNTGNQEKKGSQIIVVTSASGGTGKTTVAMGIAAGLTKNYKRVLYINASRLQNFQYMLDNSTVVSSSDVYAKLSEPTNQIYSEIKHAIRKEIFSYLPAFKAALMSIGVEYSIYEKISLSAKKSGDFDFIIIDAESTFDEDKTRLLDIADKVLIVTEQSLDGVYATNTLLSNINEMSSEKYLFVCNKFKKDAYNALIDSNMAAKFTVNEYIEYFEVNGNKKCEELSQNIGVRKVAFLII